MTTCVVTQCTGDKALSHPQAYTKKDFETSAFNDEAMHPLPSLPACEMYTGQQHVRLMEAVRERSDIDLKIVSAGYGLLDRCDPVSPYNVTFNEMSKSEAVSWARTLCLPQAARWLFAEVRTWTLVLLGKEYLRALQLDRSVKFGSPTMFLCSADSAKLVPQDRNGHPRVVVLTREDCTRFSVGMIGLKGEVAKRLLRRKDLDPYGKPHLFWDPDIVERLALDK